MWNHTFRCALGGPFGNLQFDPALSLPDSLCAHNCFDLRFIGLGDKYFRSIYYSEFDLSIIFCKKIPEKFDGILLFFLPIVNKLMDSYHTDHGKYSEHDARKIK